MGVLVRLAPRCKIRWHMKMNLREALHMVEFRPMPQGHPHYRFICWRLWRKIQEVHPALAESGKFVDWQKYRWAPVGDADGI